MPDWSRADHDKCAACGHERRIHPKNPRFSDLRCSARKQANLYCHCLGFVEGIGWFDHEHPKPHEHSSWW